MDFQRSALIESGLTNGALIRLFTRMDHDVTIQCVIAAKSLATIRTSFLPMLKLAYIDLRTGFDLKRPGFGLSPFSSYVDDSNVAVSLNFGGNACRNRDIEKAFRQCVASYDVVGNLEWRRICHILGTLLGLGKP